jgi:hypothetical protein
MQFGIVEAVDRGYLRHARPIDAVIDDEHFALWVQRGGDGGFEGGCSGAGEQHRRIVAVWRKGPTQ